jgi:hypothetical protein
VVYSGQESGQDAEHRDEPTKENNRPAIAVEHQAAELDLAFCHTDVPPIAIDEGKADLAPQPIADIVTDDSPERRCSHYAGNVQPPSRAGKDSRRNQRGLAGKRDAHTFQTDDQRYHPVAVGRNQLGQLGPEI